MSVVRTWMRLGCALAVTSAACSESTGPRARTDWVYYVGTGAIPLTGAAQTYDILRANADGGGTENLTRSPDEYAALDATHDGGTIVFSAKRPIGSVSTADCAERIWRMAADGSQRRPITSGVTCSFNPRLSPDDARIAYQRGNEIYVANLDGTAETRLTGGLPAVEPSPCGAVPKVTVHLTGWSDVNRVSFWRHICQVGEMFYTVRIDGGDLRVVDESSPRTAYLSPDRTRAAFELNGQFWIRNIDGSGARALAPTGGFPDDGFEVERSPWSPDGRWVVFTDASSRPAVASTDGGAVRPLRNPTNTFFGGWSADGSKLAWTDFSGGTTEIVVTGADGTVLRSLANPGSINRYPLWVSVP